MRYLINSRDEWLQYNGIMNVLSFLYRQARLTNGHTICPGIKDRLAIIKYVYDVNNSALLDCVEIFEDVLFYDVRSLWQFEAMC